MAGSKKWFEITVWILIGWGILKPKNAEIQKFHGICSIDFSEIWCDNRHCKGSESERLFITGTTLILPKEPNIGNVWVQKLT